MVAWIPDSKTASHTPIPTMAKGAMERIPARRSPTVTSTRATATPTAGHLMPCE